MNFKEEVEKMKFSSMFLGLRKDEVLHCATRRIGVRTGDYQSKKSNSVEISLVVVCKHHRGSRQGKDFCQLCDFEDPNMSEKEVIARAIDAYRRRWAVV